MPVNSFDNYYMSWVPEKPTDNTPMYKSFAQQLEYAILSFKLPPNTLLPPQRELADYLDVNLSTITKAYKICEQKGYLYAITGKGTFVSPNALLYKNPDKAYKTMHNLRTVEPFHVSDHLIEKATKRIIQRPDFRRLLTYQCSDLSDYHKLIASKYLQQLNVPAQPAQLMISSGSQNALTIAMLSLFQAGDRIAVDSFTYHHFKMLANFLGILLYPIENDSLGMLPERLEHACKRNHLRGIYLMPSCSNPTAVEMPLSRRRELSEIIANYNLLVLEDDSYRFLTDTLCPTFYELLPQQTIYINSTTKALSSGPRIAYLLYPSKLQSCVLNGERATNLHYNSFDAEIISELINSGDYINIRIAKKKAAQKCNELYNSIFNISPNAENPCSFFRWLYTGSDNHSSIREINAQGISVMESQLFNAGTKHADCYIRIALSSEPELSALENALQIIKSSLKIPYKS